MSGPHLLLMGSWALPRLLCCTCRHLPRQVLWDSVVVEAYGNERGLLGGAKVQNLKTNEVMDLPLAGLFFAIGHEPATKFLAGQLKLDESGYIITEADSTVTSVPGVFAAGDVQDHKYRQAITAAGSGEQPGPQGQLAGALTVAAAFGNICVEACCCLLQCCCFHFPKLLLFVHVVAAE